MSEHSKITSDHLRRCAVVYVRQSSSTQVENNRESTARQYHLAERAVELGWPRAQVKVVDEDLGISGSGLTDRAGFARMIAEVALGQIGMKDTIPNEPMIVMLSAAGLDAAWRRLRMRRAGIELVERAPR